MKKAIALLLALLFMISMLAACGSAPDNSQPHADNTGDSQESSGEDSADQSDETDDTAAVTGDITVWYPDTWSSDAPGFVDAWKADIAAQYPDVNVTFEEYVQASIQEKLTVAMATGTTPDIFYDVQSRIAPAANNGLLVDLSDVAGGISDLAENYAEIGKIGNETLYLPYTSMNCYSIAINMDIAREVGADAYLPEDSVHWSYEDFLKCCELAKEGGYYGTQLWAGGPTGDAAMFSLYMTAGSQMFSDDFSACTINNDGTRKALELVQELIDKEYVPAGAATTLDYNEAFFAGQSLFSLPQGGAYIIMQRENSYEAGEIDTIFDMDFVMYPSPDGKTEPVSASFGTNGFCIFKNDENADNIAAAKAVLKLVYDDPSYMTNIVTHTSTAPVLTTVQADVDEKYAAYVEKGDNFTATYMTNSFGILEGWWSDWRNAYYPVMQNFYSGSATIDETLASLEQAGNDVLAAYAESNS